MQKKLTERTVVEFEAVGEKNTEKSKLVMFHGEDGKNIERGYVLIGAPIDLSEGEYAGITQEDIPEGHIAVHLPEQLVGKGGMHLYHSTRKEAILRNADKRKVTAGPEAYFPFAKLEKDDE